MREASELKDRNETSRLHQYSQALRRQPSRRLQISEMPQQTAHLATRHRHRQGARSLHRPRN